jgi:hypothetical protein
LLYFLNLYVSLLEALNNYYKNLSELDKSEIVKIQRFFPHRNKYQVNGNEVRFEYLYKLTEKSTDLTWKAETDKGNIVFVKFTKNNNHPLDENILFADDKTFKGWRMIISEFSNK